MEIKVLAESDSYLAIAKPAGLLMHALPNREETEPTVADWLFKNYPETGSVGDMPEVRPGIVHRLDKDTSGILLVARTEDAFRLLKSMFQARTIRKTYLALARGHLERERNIIRRSIGISQGSTRRSVRSEKMAKDALTEYHVLERVVRSGEEEDGDGFKSTFMEVFPHTGRTHQIRVHLTSIGHPILGDAIYGPKARPSWIPRLMLHAYSLELPEFDGGVKFTAPIGQEFRDGLLASGVSGEKLELWS